MAVRDIAILDMHRVLREDIKSLYGLEVDSFSYDQGVIEVDLEDMIARPKHIPAKNPYARCVGKVGISLDGKERQFYFKPTTYEREVEFYLRNPSIAPHVVSYRPVEDGNGYVLTAVEGRDFIETGLENISLEHFIDVGKGIADTACGHGDMYLSNLLVRTAYYDGPSLTVPKSGRKVLFIDAGSDETTKVGDLVDFLTYVNDFGMEVYRRAADGVLEGLGDSVSKSEVMEAFEKYRKMEWYKDAYDYVHQCYSNLD
jgi:hypothetical protein